MPSLQLRLFQFDRLVEEFLPLLHMHLVRQGVKSSMYASQWFMTRKYQRLSRERVSNVVTDPLYPAGRALMLCLQYCEYTHFYSRMMH